LISINLGLCAWKVQTATRSVVSVQNVQTLGTKVVGQPVAEDADVKVEGIGSGFIWDKFGHIVCLLNSLHVCIVYFSVRVLENSC
jgi:S1-C subfamily serine protease